MGEKACNLSCLRAELREVQVQSQSRQHRKTLSPNKTGRGRGWEYSSMIECSWVQSPGPKRRRSGEKNAVNLWEQAQIWWRFGCVSYSCLLDTSPQRAHSVWESGQAILWILFRPLLEEALSPRQTTGERESSSARQETNRWSGT